MVVTLVEVIALFLAQAQAQAPVFRARTELVRLDVVVVDADGRAIRGLTAADFEIVDDGRPQRIATAEEVSHSTRRSAAVFPADVRRDVADNVASSADRLIVIAIDDLHFQAKTDETKSMARRVVEEVGDGAAFAVITMSGAFGVEPTTDRALVLAEIERFVDRFDPEGRRTVFGPITASDPGPLRNAIGEPVVVRGPKDPASFFGDMTTFKSLQDTAKKIAADPSPRKAFVWISGGMAGAKSVATCDTGFGSESIYCSVLSSLLEALRKANVAAYPIATGDFGARPALLRDVASGSGGFVTDASSFGRELPKLVEDLDHYYLLGFYPDSISRRGMHKLDVRVARSGAVVRHRGGYERSETRGPTRNELARLAEGALPSRDLPLRMQAVAAPAGAKAPPRTLIAIEIDAPADAGVAAGDTLRYEVWAVDLRKKKVVSSVAREATVVGSSHYQVHTLLMLAPGHYQLRASALSAKLGKGGSVFQDLIVPDYRRSPLEIGPVSVMYSDGQRVPVVRGGSGPRLFAVPITLDREFPADERVRVLCDVVQRAPEAVRIEVDLLTAAGDRARRLLEKTLQRSDPHTLDVALEFAGLSPGGYRVRIAAVAGAATSQRELALVVRGAR